MRSRGLAWHAVAGLLLMAVMVRPLMALDFSDIAKEGELRFLTVNPDPEAYRYEARVSLTRLSLETGLVESATCHRRLDPIRKVVIAFNPDRLQTLSVSEFSGIGEVQVEGHLVTLTAVERGASICITVSSHALDLGEAGVWKLHVGPLMRRYLDGYLPMAARLTVSWPQGLLAVSSVAPASQPGFMVAVHPDGAQIDTVFAGRLTGHLELARPR